MGTNIIDHAGSGNEIDIVEYTGHGFLGNAVHWNGYGQHHQSTGGAMSQSTKNWLKRRHGIYLYDGDYHTYGLEWTEGKLVFYVDNIPWRSFTHPAIVSEVPEAIYFSSEVDKYQSGFSGNVPTDGYGVKGANTNPLLSIDYFRNYSIDVPEPASVAMLMIPAGLLLCRCRNQNYAT